MSGSASERFSTTPMEKAGENRSSWRRRLFSGANRWNADLVLVFAAIPAAVIFGGSAMQLTALYVAQGGLGGAASFVMPAITQLLTQVHRTTAIRAVPTGG